MEILKFDRSKNMEKPNIFECEVAATNGEVFIKRNYIFIDGEKYLILESRFIEFNSWPKKYKLTLKHKPVDTIFNYDDLNFMYVEKIERTDELQIEISTVKFTRTVTFDSVEDCLNDYIKLKQLKKEALSSEQ